jgi:hypothetical protein
MYSSLWNRKQNFEKKNLKREKRLFSLRFFQLSITSIIEEPKQAEFLIRISKQKLQSAKNF